MVTNIEKIGAYYKFDKNGFLINPTAYSKIQIQPILNEIIEIYKSELKDDLHSIYVRGSVPKGQFIDNLSDIDTFALTNLQNDNWNDLNNHTIHIGYLLKKYPFVTGVDLKTNSNYKDFLTDNPYLGNVLKVQSLCIYGIDVIPKIPKVKINNFLLINNLSYIEIQVKVFKCCRSNTLYLRLFHHYLKLTIKTAFEIVSLERNIYTTDLYFCYEAFSLSYPKKESVLREVLYLYLNPEDIDCNFFIREKLFFLWIRKKCLTLNNKF
jgi:hypothetical protein